MKIQFRPMTITDAAALASWRYPAPYDFYDWVPEYDPEVLTLPIAQTFAAIDGSGQFVGFVCFGMGARVPGGEAAGLYAARLLDIGLGLRPDLTGQGLGAAFVDAILAESRRRFSPRGFRLSVATFNRRAIRVYERAGFRAGPTCVSPVRGQPVEFLIMTRSETAGSEQPPDEERERAQ